MAALTATLVFASINIDLKRYLNRSSYNAVRLYADQIDRNVKQVLVLVFAALLFTFAEALERLPEDKCSRASDSDANAQMAAGGAFDASGGSADAGGYGCGVAYFVESHYSLLEGDNTACVIDYASGRTPGNGQWSPPLALSFQPWVACFFASAALSFESRLFPHWTPRIWREIVDPLSKHSLLVLGVLSGAWIGAKTALGSAVLLSVLLMLARAAACCGCGLLTALSARMPRRALAASGFDRLMQAQVALCFLWELETQAPALQVHSLENATDVYDGCNIDRCPALTQRLYCTSLSRTIPMMPTLTPNLFF
eukprot:6172020-Pleurochrysis_carterae.AAC.2